MGNVEWNLPPCPCNSRQARAGGGNFVPDKDSDLSFFHLGVTALVTTAGKDNSVAIVLTEIFY